MTTRNVLYSLITAIALLVSACDSSLDEETTLTFAGDSIIARWDLQSYFSSLATTNLGLSGAGIDYIESLAGKMKGRNVVIIIGTNNSSLFNDDAARTEYVQRYISALDDLCAKKIYLYEVLPREFNNQDISINGHIRQFNSEIAAIVATRADIVYLKVFDSFINRDGHIRLQYYNDGLHLSPEGYEILSDALFRNL